MLILEMSSFSNAKQEFGQEVAVYWAQFDFSKNKRYVKKMCDLYYKDKIPQNEITKIFFDYQENEEWFNAMGINFNTLTWEQLKELVMRYTGEYEDIFKLPHQFYESSDGTVSIGRFDTFVEAANFEPNNSWCTSSNIGWFNEHHENNHEMLYIIRNRHFSKRSECRFVVAQVKLDGSKVYWGSGDDPLVDHHKGGCPSISEYENTLGDAIQLLKPMNIEDNKTNENKQYNMKTNKIRLTESQLHNVIKESVKRILSLQ